MTEIGPFDTLPRLLEQRVKATPTGTAFMSKAGTGRWQATRWDVFHQAVTRLAAKLWSDGLRPGDQVALLMPNGVPWEIIQHAVYRLGGVVIGLDLNDPAERMEDIFTLCAPKVLFVDHTHRLQHIPAQVRNRIKSITTDNLPEVSPELHGKARFSLDAPPRTAPASVFPEIDPQATATIVFTSGTTGRPKALAYQHRQLALAVQSIVVHFADLPDQAHTACWLPLANPFQRIINFCAMAMNWKAFMVPTPADIMAQVKTIGPHLFAAVPRFYEKLFEGIGQGIEKMPIGLQALAHWARRTRQDYLRITALGRRPPWHRRLKLQLADCLILRKIRGVMGANLRYFISGSAAMPRYLIDAFEALGWHVLEAYGISENIVPMAMNVPGAARPGSVGRPLAPNTLRIAEDGEILVKSVGVNGQTTSLTAEGFLKTGDIGRLDADGYLWLTGRKSDMFKLSTGRKVIPQAVEAAVSRIEPVEHCVALGSNRKFVVLMLNVPRTAWEALSAKCGGAAGAMDYLRDQSQQACCHLPQYCRPVDILVVHDTFSPQTGELTANLKLRRKALLAKHAAAIDALYQGIETREERHGRGQGANSHRIAKKTTVALT